MRTYTDSAWDTEFTIQYLCKVRRQMCRYTEKTATSYFT